MPSALSGKLKALAAAKASTSTANTNDDNEENAAIKIQAFVRGHLDRNKVSDMVGGLITELQNSMTSMEVPTPEELATIPGSVSKPSWAGLASSTLQASTGKKPKWAVEDRDKVTSDNNNVPSWVKEKSPEDGDESGEQVLKKSSTGTDENGESDPNDNTEDEYAALKGEGNNSNPPKRLSSFGQVKFPSLQSGEASDDEVDDAMIGEALKEMYEAETDDTTTGDLSADDSRMTTSDVELDEDFINGIREYMEEEAMDGSDGDVEFMKQGAAGASESSGIHVLTHKKRESVALADRINKYSTSAQTNKSKPSSLPVAQAQPKSNAPSIASRIQAFNTRNEELGQTASKNSAADDEDEVDALAAAEKRALDFAARQYLLHMSATKIQALTRGYNYRKKDFSKTKNVVEKLVKKKKQAVVPGNDTDEDDVEEEEETEVEIPEAPMAKEEGKKLSAFAVRQNLMKKSATKIQALVRGRAARKVDLAGMMYAVAWLKKAREVEVTSTEELDEELSDSDDDFDDPEVSSFMARQIHARKAAIKIQKIARGYLCRRIDYGAMMEAIEYVKVYQEAYAPTRQTPEPKIKHLEKVCAILEENDVVNAYRKEDAAIAKPNVDVQNLLKTWEWLKKTSSAVSATKSVQEDDQNNAPIDANQPKARPAQAMPELKQLSGLYRYMEAHNLHTSDRSRFVANSGIVQTTTEVLKSGGNQYRPEEEVKTRYFRDESVEAGGDADASAQEQKIRVFYDSSVQSGGLSAEPNQELKKRVYYDSSVQVGGSSVDQKPKVRYLYDNSISAGGTGENHGSEMEINIIPPPKVGEMVTLWKWLESNNMDMSVFKKWEDGNPSNVEPVHSTDGSIENQVDVSSDDATGTPMPGFSGTTEEGNDRPTMLSMLSYWKFSNMYAGSKRNQDGKAQDGPSEGMSEEMPRSTSAADSLEGEISRAKPQVAPSGKGVTPSWMKINRPDKKGDDDSEGSGPIEWVIDDDDNRVKKSSDAQLAGKTSKGTSSKGETPSWMKINRAAEKGDDDSEGSGPIEWVIDDDGNQVKRSSDVQAANKTSKGTSNKGEAAPWMKINRPDKKGDDDSEGSGPIEWVIDDDGNQVQKNSDIEMVDKTSKATSSKGETPPWMKINRPAEKKDDDSEGSGPIEFAIDEDGNHEKTSERPGWMRSPWIHSSRNADFDDDSSEESDPIEWILDDDDAGQDGEKSKAGRARTGKTKAWILAPSENRMMSTLQWMEDQGMDFDNVKVNPPSEKSVEPDRSDQEQKDSGTPSTNDMISTLSWLQQRGLYSRNGSFGKRNKKEVQSPGGKSDDGLDATRDSDEFDLDVDVAELPKDLGTPAVADMADALNWLKSRGFGSKSTSGKKAKELGSSKEEDKSESAYEPSKNMLYSLSWLQKQGLELETKESTESTPGSSDKGKQSGSISISKNKAPPSIQDMLSAVVWLDKKGFNKKKMRGRISVSRENVDDDDSPPAYMYDAIEWLEERGVPEAMSRTEQKDGKVPKNDSNAANWLEKSGFKLDKAKAAKKSRFPSADDVAKTLESLAAEDIQRIDQTSGKGARAQKKPSTDDMKAAFNFLESREKQDKKPEIPSWKQKLLTVKNMIQGDTKPEWLERRIAAINKAGGTSANVGVVQPISSVDKAREATSDAASRDIDVKKEEADVPSWKAKLKAAKKTILAEDGEQRPKWLEKRISAVQAASGGKFGTAPSASDVKNAMNFLDKTESPKPEKKSVKAGTKGQILRDGKKYTKKVLPTRGQKTNSWFQAPGEDEAASNFTENKATKTKATKKKTDGTSKTRKSSKKDKLSLSPPSSPRKINKEKEALSESPSSLKSPLKAKKARQYMSEKEREIDDALKWLKTGIANSVEDIAYYKKLNAILPTRDSQTLEDRAKEMVKAMKWVKKQAMESNKEGSEGNVDGKLEKSNEGSNGLKKSSRKKRASLNAGESPRKGKKGTTKLSRNESKDELVSPRKGKKGLKKKESMGSPVKSPKKSSKKGNEPADKPTSRGRDFDNALAWLNNKSDHLEDARYFKKLDTMMPKKPGQSLDDRAKEMVKALKFVRKTKSQQKNEEPSVDGTEAAVDKQSSKSVEPDGEVKSSSPIPLPPALMGNSDAADVFRWLNHEATNSEDVAQFKKVNSMVPKKTGQSNEDRAMELAKALKFLRKKGIGVAKSTDTDEPGTKIVPTKKPLPTKIEKQYGLTKGKPAETLKVPETTPTKPKTIPPEVMSDKDTGDVLKWLNNDSAMGAVDAAQFKKVNAMIPKKPGQSNEERAVELAKALKFLRKKGIGMEKQTEESEARAPASKKEPEADKNSKVDKWGKVRNVVKDIPKNSVKKPPTASETARLRTILSDKVSRNALKFLKKEALDLGESANDYKRVDATLPRKAGQSNEERAIDIAKGLKLLRKKGVVGGKSKSKDAQKGSTPSPEEDLANALAWVQNKEAGKDIDTLEDAGYFKKLDKMVAKKTNQSAEDRAREMVKLLAWMRKKGLAS